MAGAGPTVRLEGSLQRWDKPLDISFTIPGLPTDGPSLRVRDQVTSSAQVTGRGLSLISRAGRDVAAAGTALET